MKISVRSWNLQLPMYEGIMKAGQMGFDGIALWYAEGFVQLQEVQQDDGKAILDACEEAGLEISALTGGLGSFRDPEHRPVAVQKTRDELAACEILGIPRITSHVGVMPENMEEENAVGMRDALKEVGEEAAEKGLVLACETGPEDAQTMYDFIAECDTDGLAINYDPANFHLRGYEWLEGVEIFGPLIDHTHAKDAKKQPDGEVVQTPLGEGDIDFRKWIDALSDVGFDGWLCIERETGEDRLREIEEGLRFLRGLME
ncbi:MAG: sugar phosphate isomerase/epimerase family protein [Armatimonadota bacterium]